MARRPRLFAPGLLYHVIVRGNQRQKTFLDQSDYQAYLERLGRYRRKFGHTIHSFCLMPNHVHLLVESSEQPLAKFMQGLQQSYSQNSKRGSNPLLAFNETFRLHNHCHVHSRHANRLTQITQGKSVVQFGYDTANRRTSLTLPNGIVVEYGYDAASRVTSITYKQNGTTVIGSLTYE